VLVGLASLIRRPPQRIGRFALAAAALVLAMSLSPTLQDPVTIAMWHGRYGFALPDFVPKGLEQTLAQLPDLMRSRGIGQWDHGLAGNLATQSEVDTQLSIEDATLSKRIEAARFFFDRGMEKPFAGHGTGYGYTFKTPAHNTFIALFAENGLPGALLSSAIFLLLGVMAISRRSPLLVGLVAVGAIASITSHTILVEPWFIVLIGSAVGDNASLRRKTTLN